MFLALHLTSGILDPLTPDVFTHSFGDDPKMHFNGSSLSFSIDKMIFFSIIQIIIYLMGVLHLKFF